MRRGGMMADFEVEFDSDFLSDLLETDFDELCEEALNEASPILEEAVKKEARKVIDHEGDSEMVESFKAHKAKKTINGAWIVNVTPKGVSNVKFYYGNNKGGKSTRKYQVSNALKAIWKNYGIPGKQTPKPFLGNATRAAEKGVLSKIQDAYNKKVGIK